jgi:hypothetical protein
VNGAGRPGPAPFASRTRKRQDGERHGRFQCSYGRTRGQAAGTSGRVFAVLLPSVAYFMVVLDALVVATALPSMHRSLGGGIGTLQWTVSAYAITFGAGILTAVALGDRLGRRRVYLAGLALFTAASAACALAPTAGILITCRAVQGTGAAIVTPLGLTLLTSAFPADRRGTVVGIWGAIAGLAVASGPLVGGGDHPGTELALDLLGQRADRRRGNDRNAAAPEGEPGAASTA